MTDGTKRAQETLVVVPCLDEARHIRSVVTSLLRQAGDDFKVVVVDGGSLDGTRGILAELAAAEPSLVVLDNPKRIQSAAVNLAVELLGGGSRFLIRMDAHAVYPAGYCRMLVAEARSTGADAVVVGMTAKGSACFQRGVAAAQNSVLGNGGSLHRSASRGQWVDHGHHALITIAAFRAAGGYDEGFTHNEDAELDVRLRKLGCRIWLTGATSITYVPRATPLALFRQYFRYGKGRARNLLKHRTRPKLRQSAPVVIVPAAVLALTSPISLIAALPLLVWSGICLLCGMWKALETGRPCLAASGPAAMIMHFGWSLGFWAALISWPRLRAG